MPILILTNYSFQMIVDSVFICFCEDCDINDGAQRPYYMSKEMMVRIDLHLLYAYRLTECFGRIVRHQTEDAATQTT